MCSTGDWDFQHGDGVKILVVGYTGSSSEMQRIFGLLTELTEDWLLLVNSDFLCLWMGCEVHLETLGAPVAQRECIDSSRISLYVCMVVEIFKHLLVCWYACTAKTKNAMTCGRLLRMFAKFAICVCTLTPVQRMFLCQRQ